MPAYSFLEYRKNNNYNNILLLKNENRSYCSIYLPFDTLNSTLSIKLNHTVVYNASNFFYLMLNN